MEIKTIRELKKGEYFKVVNSKGVASATVYVRDEYDREERKYMAVRFDDISSSRLFKGTQTVTTDFIF